MRRRLLALGAVFTLQVWSLAPMAASVIYCIGEDGHSGFELVKAGARGCASCCHGQEGESPRLDAAPSAECTDIALAPADGIAGKASDAAVSVSFVALPLPAVTIVETHALFRQADPNPPRGSPTRMLRRTVLLI